MGFIIDYLREKLPLNRVVIGVTAIITPIATGIGGTVATWLMEKFPLAAAGLGGKVAIVAAFVTGAVATASAIVTLVYKWLANWGAHEQRIHEAATAITTPPPPSAHDPGAPVHDASGEDMRRALADKPEQAHRKHRQVASAADDPGVSHRGG